MKTRGALMDWRRREVACGGGSVLCRSATKHKPFSLASTRPPMESVGFLWFGSLEPKRPHSTKLRGLM